MRSFVVIVAVVGASYASTVGRTAADIMQDRSDHLRFIDDLLLQSSSIASAESLASRMAYSVFQLAGLIETKNVPIQWKLEALSRLADGSRASVVRVIRARLDGKAVYALQLLRSKLTQEFFAVSTFSSARGLRTELELNRRLQPLEDRIYHLNMAKHHIRECLVFEAMVAQFTALLLPIVQDMNIPDEVGMMRYAELDRLIYYHNISLGCNYRSIRGALLKTRMELARQWWQLDAPDASVGERILHSIDEVDQVLNSFAATPVGEDQVLVWKE